MIDYKKIEGKVKSMSAHDIIMAMVNGLRQPRTKIDMSTFGEKNDGVCFGCAATNAILHIMDAGDEEVNSHIRYRSLYEEPFYEGSFYEDPLSEGPLYDGTMLRDFECAIDSLRCGHPEIYNVDARSSGFAQITPIPGQELPRLEDDYTEEQLQEYVKLARYQLTK